MSETDFGNVFAEPVVNGAAPDSDFGTGEEQPLYGPVADEGDDSHRERAPRHVSAGGRTPLADLVTLAWGGVGLYCERSNVDVPVGRTLQFQAPLAGNKVDELIAGTWLDSVLQPFAKQAGKVEGIGALILFPLLVGMYERNPEMEPLIAPMLRQVIESSLVDMAPVLKKKAAQEKKAAQSISDITQAFHLEPGENPVDAVLASLFAPPPGYVPEPEPEP